MLTSLQYYVSHMSQRGIFGTETEIQAATSIFLIEIIVIHDDHPSKIYGENIMTNYEVTLRFSEDIDRGHYEVIDYFNQNYEIPVNNLNIKFLKMNIFRKSTKI